MGWSDLGAILTFAGVILTTIITTLAVRGKNSSEARKNDAEGEASLSKATMDFANQIKKNLEDQIASMRVDNDRKLDNLRERVISLEAENRIYRMHNAMLIEQLVGAGIRPVDPPSPSPPFGDD